MTTYRDYPELRESLCFKLGQPVREVWKDDDGKNKSEDTTIRTVDPSSTYVVTRGSGAVFDALTGQHLGTGAYRAIHAIKPKGGSNEQDSPQ